MKASTVLKAVAEAQRFLDAAKLLTFTKYGSVEYGKDSGAAKRASMDLTRALSEMRKP